MKRTRTGANNNDDLPDNSGWKVNDQWMVIKKIASGGFGAVYKGEDMKTGEMVAIKTERRVDKNYLMKEMEFFDCLQGNEGVPVVYWHGEVEELRDSGKIGSCYVIVMEFLGPSLSDLYYKNGKKFSLKTVLMIGIQMISCVETVHKAGLVHRDIKPGNFIMGLGDNQHIVYIIDYGLAFYYREFNGSHILDKQDVAFRGTHRYSSMNSLEKNEQSRRDDLVALGNVLIYLAKGKLPWQNLKYKRENRRRVVVKKMKDVTISELTSDLPSSFCDYMTYTRELRFEETPDYNYLRQLFTKTMNDFEFENDNVFDWTGDIFTDDSSTSTEADERPKKKKRL